MKITADTNVLVRAITGDDPRQSEAARADLAKADLIALPLPVLCELVWVLSRGYKIPAADIADTVRRLVRTSNVRVNRPAVSAGLAMMEAGGDFADGIIAHEGEALGGEIFVTFDQTAIRLLGAQRRPARQPG